MSWWQSLPVILTAVLLLLLPGLATALAVRMRGISALLVAPAFSVGTIGFLALTFPFSGIPWSPVPVLVGCAVVSIVAFFVSKFCGSGRARAEQRASRSELSLTVGIGVVITSLVIGMQMATAMIHPDSISQTYDNVFHLNAVRWAMESQNSSPLNLGAFTGISAYPAGWHAFVAIVGELTGATIPVLVNSTSIAIGAVAWPLSALFLTFAVAGYRKATAIVTLVFSAGFATFPILMIDWGVLYPNLLSISVLPAALGLAFTALGLGYHNRPPALIAWLSLGVAVAGVALAHPSTLMAFLAFALPGALAVYYFRIRRLWPPESRESRRQALILTAALLGGLVLLTVVWYFLRPPSDAANWRVVQTPPQAIGELLFNAPLGRPSQEILSVCLIAGIIHLWITKSRRWLIGTYLIGAALFFFAAGYNAPIRQFITGVWYFDSYRLAALLPVVVLGPAVIGALFLVDLVREKIRTADGSVFGKTRLPGNPGPTRQAVLASVVYAVALVPIAPQLLPVNFASYQAHWQYRSDANAALLSPEERRLLERLPQTTEPGANIAGLPSSGTALAYALSGRTVIQPHILTTHGSDVDVVNAGLKNAADFPAVCESVRSLNVRYVLDFGTRTVTGTLAGYGGVMDLEENASLELVDSEGSGARLFKVTACW
ncbi:DUF6541 family protein [Pseudarthrobacter oxydans]|uniref:DUF6541 family protein n=1 Tax=Pseudarthrobacter oxydans TaxID=1671 RepID=UPI00286BFDAF|nr:DUF6541 family protein [Pseudarthrobacter oxydans]